MVNSCSKRAAELEIVEIPAIESSKNNWQIDSLRTF